MCNGSCKLSILKCFVFYMQMSFASLFHSRFFSKQLLKELDCDSMTIEEFYVFCNENEVALPAHSLEKTTHPVCDNIPLDRVATFPRGTDSGNMSTCPSGESPVFTLTNRFHEVTGSSLDVAELDRQQSVSSICSDDSKHDECVGNRQPATTTFSTDDKIEDLNGMLERFMLFAHLWIILLLI